ncbi:diacylglycerol/lipid kinase family protein [Melghirimyces algeriensis]|uniref:Lipid kinase, YegS/Rv2252/BmrU family n=1 Tax=Melghirimyces algeriensis TaxID=910412 RepID=A0A521DF70_9BACL|nr:diacylglycerol kinase family protein [Melghirimyces algeriensis]SMO70266.1 lipid kinase, YegS/Rv2252/BmrU family [Melghirimyces algeriensis]
MYIFIVNPASGNGRGERVWFQVQQLLSQYRIAHQVFFTKFAGHAVELTRLAMHLPHIRSVIAIGGDGTVHEVGNALIGTDRPLGYIPSGTGNDFALAHAIPSSPVQALRRVLKHQVYRIDTAKMGKRFLIGFAGIGFDGQVAKVINDSVFNRRMGRFAYLLGFMQALRNYQPAQLSLTLDGETYEYQRVWLIAVANIPNYGGGMNICPGAAPNDGHLDICCVTDLSRMQLVKLFPSVYRGKHIQDPSVRVHRARKVTLQTDPPLIVHADGEVIGKTPLSITVFPDSLMLL